MKSLNEFTSFFKKNKPEDIITIKGIVWGYPEKETNKIEKKYNVKIEKQDVKDFDWSTVTGTRQDIRKFFLGPEKGFTDNHLKWDYPQLKF